MRPALLACLSLAALPLAAHPPYSLAPDGKGGVYVLHWAAQRLLRVGADGRVTTVVDLRAVLTEELRTDVHDFVPGRRGTFLFAATYAPRLFAWDGKRMKECAWPLGANVLQVERHPAGGLVVLAWERRGGEGYRIVRLHGKSARVLAELPARARLYYGGMAVGGEGEVYLASRNRLLRVTAEGMEVVVPATAGLRGPWGLWVQPGPRVLVAEMGGERVVAVDREGRIQVVAGRGKRGGEDGPAREATFDRPFAVAADEAGRIYVAEYTRGPRVRLRVRAVKAGRVATLADLAAR